MKYLIVLFMILSLNANENLKMYKEEVNSLINYTLKTPSDIYNMFIIQKPIKKVIKKKKRVVKKIKPKIFNIKPKNNIKLVAILNNEILLKVNNKMKWVKVGQKVDNYKIVKILNHNSVVILYNNKIKTLPIGDIDNTFKIKVK